MREIIFRGFHECENGENEITIEGRKVEGDWIEGVPCYIKNATYIIAGIFGKIANFPVLIEVISETVGEYTGLTDKNNNKIFEGDIVKGQIVSAWAKAEIVCKVEYIKDGFVSVECCRGRTVEHKLMFAKPIVIIGNIHDNPELLGELK